MIEQSTTTNSMFVRVINGEAELQTLMQSCRLIVIQFWAEWCPPCRQLKPILEQEAESSQVFALALINIDLQQNAPLVTKYNVQDEHISLGHQYSYCTGMGTTK